MLWRRQEATRLPGDEPMEKPLRALAFTMMTRQTRGLSRAELAEGVDNLWWRETILLYAAMVPADPIVEACLTTGTINTLALAYDHFLDIAAGVTILERRADGRSPATETIMLATS